MKITKIAVLALALSALVCAFAACGTPDNTALPPETEPLAEAPHVHNYVETEVVEPTCYSIGKSAKACECGDILADSEMPVPMLYHDATDVNCTEDSVCKLCGEVIIEKFGHTYAETVVTVASCTSEGKITTKCVRCGEDGETKTIPAGHSFDTDNVKVLNGDVSATCTKCGKSASLLSGTPVLKLDFDSAEELYNLSSFAVRKPAGIQYENGACRPGDALWIDYDPATITSMEKYVISLDFKLTGQGRTNGGDSIFSFCAKNPNTYTWMVKLYQTAGVLSTATDNFDASNSVPATVGEWYNFVAIVDNSTRYAEIYINGVNIGRMYTINYESGRTDFSFRFGDMPNNAPSKPYFDNFKLVEIK